MRWLAFLLLTVLLPSPVAAAPPRKTENIIVITLDGFRYQEFFGGADDALIDAKAGGVKDLPGLKSRYWRDSAKARREALLPFFWGTIAKHGQVFGNPARKATARSTNGLKFSYPGYSEMFCGFADERIDSNAKRDNPNLSVLEFLNGRPGFKGRVEAVCTWDVFPYIFRSRKNGLPVLSGWEPMKASDLTERERYLNELLEMTPRIWPDNTFDAFTMQAAKSAITRRSPRVLYIGLGETDEWGHGRRYDLYLDAAHKSDRFLAALWQALQANPKYKDKTALLITTDHGRGSTRTDWTDHGKNVPNAEFIWAAVMGPDVPALGERESVEVTQSQVAATIAALVGEDFHAASPKAAAPFPLTANARKVEIIGHRGASYDAPENTVTSFKEAWRQGADGAELDVFLTKDGKLIELDAGRWKDAKFAGERLPTLAEMLATVPAGKKVYIEVKCGPEAVPEIDRVIKASGLYAARTPIISFHAEVIAAMKKARPDVPAYWIVNLKPKKDEKPPTAEALIAKAKEIKADGLDLSAHETLDVEFGRKVKAAGLRLDVWTVNDPKVAKRMIEAGVDGITTDRPGWLRKELAE
jgi:glycerophosphoryl diester phosphodiesterase